MMIKRISIGIFILLLLLANIENLLDGQTTVAIVIVVVVIYGVFGGNGKAKQDGESTACADCSVDGKKQGKGVGLIMFEGWAVLAADCPVYEAKEIAEKLESAGLRCRLQVSHEDRAFHRFGNFGMGTRMCVLVPPGEYERASAVVK